VVLLGDASHPLSGKSRPIHNTSISKKNELLIISTGAFGSGAAFALEDGWILARALEFTTTRPRSTDEDVQTVKIQSIADALEIFNEIRSPYYLRMHKHLDNAQDKVLKARTEAKAQSSDPKYIFESVLDTRIGLFGSGDEMNWIYRNDIEAVWQDYLRRPTVSNL
jgi:salicylate hydroxylase